MIGVRPLSTLGLGLGLVLALVACARAEPRAASGVVVGEMRVVRVVDGDTIWVDGLSASLRLLGIDTEETFKTAADRRAYAAGWARYAAGKRGDSLRPAKFATPLGEDAKHYATKFFAGVDRVRVERDDPAEIRDRYDRYLAYVFAHKDGAWVLYNVECVRAGMAPYFTKYGRSRRFDAEFVAAEAEAKAAQRGIWAPGAEAYPDYPERAAWWNARGEFVAQFRERAATDASYIDVTHDDALHEVGARAGTEVVVLGTVGDVFEPAPGGDARAPVRVVLSRHAGEDLPLVFFDREAFVRSGVARWKGEFVTVRGRPSIYKHETQIVIDDPRQITLSPVPGLTP